MNIHRTKSMHSPDFSRAREHMVLLPHQKTSSDSPARPASLSTSPSASPSPSSLFVLPPLTSPRRTTKETPSRANPGTTTSSRPPAPGDDAGSPAAAPPEGGGSSGSKRSPALPSASEGSDPTSPGSPEGGGAGRASPPGGLGLSARSRDRATVAPRQEMTAGASALPAAPGPLPKKERRGRARRGA